MKTRHLLPTALLLGTSPVAAEMIAEPIVVTATRIAQTVDASLASVTVITREEIERLQPAQFSDLLRSRAGISVADNGPFGKTSSVFMRGTNSNHTLLLVDGVRMGPATAGGPSWHYLPVSEIERIEIVRGPRASIYGADAIGGVVQVFTRQGSEGPVRFNAHTRIGEFNTREVGAGVRGGTAQTHYSLSASHLESDGINVRPVGDDARDGYRNRSLSGRLVHRTGQGLELFLSGLHSQGRSDYDDPWFDFAYNDFTHSALTAGVRSPLWSRGWTELSYSHATDQFDGTDSWPVRNETYRDQLNWRNEFSLSPSTVLSAGLEWQRERVSSSTDFDESRRSHRAGYGLIQTVHDRHNLLLALRHDDNQAYGHHTTGQMAWGFDLTERLTSRLSWGSAFRAPNFVDRYVAWGGNPDLKPERSSTLEAGLRLTADHYHLDATLYETRVNDLIAWDGAQMNNVHRARMRGVEVEGSLQSGPWQLRSSITLLEARNRVTGNELARRPREQLRLDLDRQLGAFSLGSTVTSQGRSFDDAGNATRLAGFTLVDLRATWQPAPQWRVRATINNLFDRQYETAGGFNQPGRAAYLSLHYQQ